VERRTRLWLPKSRGVEEVGASEGERAPDYGLKSLEREDASDTPERFTSAASAASPLAGAAAGPNTFQRVDPSRLPPGQTAGVTPRPRCSSVPPAGDSKSWGRCPRSYPARRAGAAGSPPRFGPRC